MRAKEQRFLVDVGMSDLPFPMKVISRDCAGGQSTIANISVNARIMHEFEARWIDEFIKIVHEHRDRIGTETLGANIKDYGKRLKASMVRIDFDYPFFIEKRTPVAKEKCLVRYLCRYSAKSPSIGGKPSITFRISVPCITTYPSSRASVPQGLFGQLSVFQVEVVPKKEVYPEDIVDIVDRHAIVPVYSFLTEEDQNFVIAEIHSKQKTSVVALDEIKTDLANNNCIDWYSVTCSNYGMLHTYSTVISTEKSSWVPFSGYEGEV
ncbi:MAG: GTP cyclohydrolase, FolE2/MptA family [Kiritimatiellae bacterium]|nr:GTP cyclohydrolase, FolE2/MptA family [Kiritimatiellia bacterium]